LGFLYLASKALPILNNGPQEHFDFRMFWLAGQVWGAGHNPYDVASYPDDYFEAFNRARVPFWFYPPYWYPLLVPLGHLPFQTALDIWKIVNCTLLIGGTYLLARALADVARQKTLPIFLAGIGFVCLLEATADTIWSGQSSVLVYFGFAAIVFGLLQARSFPLIVGLIFLALKPQVGIVAFAAIAGLRHQRWTILPAGAICLLATIPIVITGDYRGSVEGFVATLTHHSGLSANAPAHMTGLVHITDFITSVTNIPITTQLGIPVAILVAFVLFYYSSFSKSEPAQFRVATLALFVASTLFFIPLHYYDLVSLAVLFMTIFVMPLPGWRLIALGLVVCFRPGVVWRVFDSKNVETQLFFYSRLASIALFVAVAGALWATYRSRSQAVAAATI
jgi:hypothetical protein